MVRIIRSSISRDFFSTSSCEIVFRSSCYRANAVVRGTGRRAARGSFLSLRIGSAGAWCEIPAGRVGLNAFRGRGICA